MPKIRGMDDMTLIRRLDGPAAVARLLGIKQPSVSGWIESGVIPEFRRIRLAVIAEQRGIATRRDLFPNDYARIWPELAEKKVA